MSQTFWTTVKHWVDQQSSVGGVVTFNPVDDDGLAVFSVIYAVQFTGELNTALATSIPMCALKAISADKTTITGNVSTGTILGLLGATMLAAPDGTIVHALVMGN